MSFKLEDIKIGYMVEVALKKREDLKRLCVVTVWEGDVIFTNGETWFQYDDFDEDFGSYYITKVWGYPEHAECMWYNNTDDRSLLWERPCPKKMTKAEIEEILGYDIEIVEY